MDEKQRTGISKFLSKVLRHEPESAGLTLERGGWVPIVDLLSGLARSGTRISREDLDVVVSECEKQRFAIDDTGTKIRANQGHSAEVELQFEPVEPPTELYDGTTETNISSVLRDGLLKMARHHVHLSADGTTARKVGGRHGKPVVITVHAAQMSADGYIFYRSANGVWLVDHVPPQYLRL
ncbi:RNA 2'-phosphotransferase [Gemmata obscuriglobus]|uniref:Probable RNA 2'-phosphotransferase n=1 Tax=Gemmata obscuriglobus TaxID=114 RepID=A0A2Z3H2Y7_9BACT|nr:RNA 2'-phosphotransferase [Gemmata obscuriglobus]AWM38077.1 RNA 2'-phosphotransferase [Gemmata obscuriglobus]QEG29046.1 RNA 2'-phosphotransferase [Gemmata obscuriglobus]VTS07667.1 rna 2 -phosphotransferase : Probable RNA 2'-phosphotransferase OS=Nostoc punctiforme (strain ATCC 29133 / PCC 73102) GN=kptA PE=3 SV=1: PTS_2-RNA [Gemmata obscuriglobus UQM 2246]